MINYKQLTEYIQDGIQAAVTPTGGTAPYNITVNTQVGEYKYQPVQGKIRTQNAIEVTGNLLFRPSDTVPIHGLSMYTLTSHLEFVVPVQIAQDLCTSLQKYIDETVGTATAFTDTDGNKYAATLGFDTPVMSSRQIYPGVGNGVLLSCFIYFQLIKDGVISNQCVITIDGEPMLYLSAGIANTSQAFPANVGNNEYATSTKTMQTLALSIKIPYINTNIVKTLMREVFDGSLSATHTLTYSDGVAYLSTAPYTATINTSNMNISLAPNTVPSIDISVALATTFS